MPIDNILEGKRKADLQREKQEAEKLKQKQANQLAAAKQKEQQALLDESGS